MIYININDKLYPATIKGRVTDHDWDGRESREITLSMTHEEASQIFVNGTSWSIVDIKERPVFDDDGNAVVDEEGNSVMEEYSITYDNSAFNVAGNITTHRDGTVSVKMGKLTDLEEAYEIILGGIQSHE